MDKLSGIQKLSLIFTRRERRLAYGIFFLSLLGGLTQSLGIVSILPFINVILDPDIIFRNAFLTFAYETLGFTRALHFLIFLGGLVFVVLMGSNIIAAINIWAKTRFVNQRNHVLSVKLLKRYLTNPYEFFLNHNSNELSKNVLAEVSTLTGGYLMSLMEIVTHGFILLFIVITILLVDFVASSIAIVIFGILYGTIMLQLKSRLKRRGELVRQENHKRYRYTNEGLTSFKITKVIQAEDYFLEAYGQSSQAFARHNTFAQVAGAMPRFLVESVAMGGLMLFVLTQLALGRELESLAPVVAVLGLAGYRMLPALQIVYQQLAQLQYTRPVLDRIFDDMIDLKNLSNEVSSNIPIEPLPFTQEIRIEKGSFKYASGHLPVINGIDLTIPKHQIIGLVGATGSGKTTLVDVLMGLLQLHAGSLKIDGQIIDENNVKAWQKNIGYVPQDIYLTDDTLARNIAFGIAPEAIDPERIREVARIASLSEFIEQELPDQYETFVGERGVRLSGGQRQRIGIARALYRNPSVLILDEATSALDGTTEAAVLKAMTDAAKERTVIMVAHRLNTLIDCDVIYLLSKGNIIASGDYETLLRENKTFQKMAKAKPEKTAESNPKS